MTDQAVNSCASIRIDLDLYRDQALEPNRQHQVKVHIDHCEPCRAELEVAQSIENQIRSELCSQPAPALWNRITASVQAQKQAQHQTQAQGTDQHSTTRQGQSPLFTWMTAALLLITVTVGGYGLLKQDVTPDSDTLASALINEFHTFVVSHRDLDFIDSHPAQIRSWFGDKVDFRVPMPVDAADLQLAGGRLCNMLDKRIASFMYQVDGAWVSLYIMRSAVATQNTGESHEILKQGYAFIDWKNEGLHYSLVGDLPVERLRQIAERLRSTRISTHLTRLPGAADKTIQSLQPKHETHDYPRQWQS
jgi:anti-sigma factor RsiW